MSIGLPSSKYKLALLLFIAVTCAGVFLLIPRGGITILGWNDFNFKGAETTYSAVTSKRWNHLLDDEVEENLDPDFEWASTTTTSSVEDVSSEQKSSELLIPDLSAPGKLSFLRERFSQRSQLLNQKCSQYRDLKASSMNNAKVKFMKVAYAKLNYCPVPKVGTTFTRAIQRRHFRGKSARHRGKPQKNYVLVREPFSRLMSGYIGKIVTNQAWWKTFGQLIISKFRPEADRKSVKCGYGATFPEYVKYLIYSQEIGRFLNTHFQPIHQQCGFCRIDFDYIGHLETLADDMSFMLNAVNITGKDLNFDDSEGTILGKCRDTVRHRIQISKCVDICSMMKTVWWSFQARGLISKNIDLPIRGNRCDSISGDEFGEIALRAHKASLGNTNRSKQKREALVELFTQVPLSDRLRLRELYMPDFELFGYDSMPSDLFPEMYRIT